jgi:hypothetical protein
MVNEICHLCDNICATFKACKVILLSFNFDILKLKGKAICLFIERFHFQTAKYI